MYFIELCDALKKLDILKEKSIDLAIIDPPYKLNKTTGGLSNSGFSDRWQGNIKGSNKYVFENNNISFEDWLPKVYRVLKENSHCYIWVNDKNLSDLQKAAEKVGFKLHNILVWKKNNLTPNRWYMKNCEFILFLYKGKAKSIKNMSCSQFFECKNKLGRDKLHPTEKPIQILEELILNSSEENDFVLDCFMGSGSTGVACLRTKRNFLGFEIDENYYNIATKNLREVSCRLEGGK